MKLLYLPLVLFLLLFSPIEQADPIDNVASFIKQGNTKELAKLFATTVELTIIDDEGAYPKDKAAGLLDKFFIKNKPQSIKLLHKINSSSSFHLGVFILTTEDKKQYRVAITLKGMGSATNIIELRLEEEKVK